MNAALAVFALALTAWIGWAYNRLVRLDNRARSAWADIDVQLRKRHDLVGNLVETVRGYATHERTVLENVARARAEAHRAVDGAGPAASADAENAVTRGMKALLVLVEAYPELAASARFLDLQQQLVAVEDDLESARRYYNAVVRDLNSRVQSFPDLLLARVARFVEREFFELEERSQALAPAVSLEGDR